MAAPVVAGLLVTIGRATAQTFRYWRGILAWAGLIAATGFSFSYFVKQAASSAVSLWPLAALAFGFLLAREVVRQYVIIKKQTGDKNER